MSNLNAVTTLTQSGNMIENRIQTVQIPLNQMLANCFQAIQLSTNDGVQTNLVSLNPSNNLVRFYPDPGSQSGWDHEEIYFHLIE